MRFKLTAYGMKFDEVSLPFPEAVGVSLVAVSNPGDMTFGEAAIGFVWPEIVSEAIVDDDGGTSVAFCLPLLLPLLLLPSCTCEAIPGAEVEVEAAGG